MTTVDDFWSQEHVDPIAADVDTAIPASPLDRRIGDGEMPAEFDVFSWPAFAFAGVWAIAYRAWWILAVVLAVGGSSLVMGVLGAKGLSPVILVPVHGILLVSVKAFLLWLGLNGHRLAWRAAQRRAAKGRPLPKQSVRQVLGLRRTWMLIAVMLELLTLALLVQQLFTPPAHRPLITSVILMASVVVTTLAALDLDFHGVLWRILFARKRTA